MDKNRLIELELAGKLLEKEEDKKREEELREKRRIINKIVEMRLEELHPHELNKELYLHGAVNLSVVDSLLKHGQISPFQIDKSGKIIDGLKRFLAMQYINTHRLKSLVLDEGSLTNYHPEIFVEMRPICLIVNIPDELDTIKFITLNKKSFTEYPTQIYNKIRGLYKINSAETKNKKNRASILRDIAEEIDQPLAIVKKVLPLGDAAYLDHDEVARKILQKLDSFSSNLTKIFDIFKLRLLQKKLDEDSPIFSEIQQEIDDSFQTAENLENDVKDGKKSDKDLKTTQIVRNETLKQYQDRVREIRRAQNDETKRTRKKNRYDVVLVEPEKDNAETFNARELKAEVNSSIIVISCPENLTKCTKLMKRLKFVYQTYIICGKQIILLGTRGNKNPPKTFDAKINSRSQLYKKIQQWYPNDCYHEVLNSNTPGTPPDGWEVLREVPKKTVAKSATADQTA